MFRRDPWPILNVPDSERSIVVVNRLRRHHKLGGNKSSLVLPNWAIFEWASFKSNPNI